MRKVLKTVRKTLGTVQKYGVLRVVKENARLHRSSIGGALAHRDDLTYKLKETRDLLEKLKKATLRFQLKDLIRKDLKMIDRHL